MAADNPQGNLQPTPDLELLEFLGSFATDEGEWIDPSSLLEEEFSTLLDSVAESAQENTQEDDNRTDQDSAND